MTGYAFTNFGAIDLLAAQYSERTFAPHFHETYAFGIILKGRCEFQRGGIPWVAREGDLFVVHPYELHTAATGDLQYWAMYPDTRWLRRLARCGSGGELPYFPSAVYRDAGALRRLIGQGPDQVAIERWLAAVIERHAAGYRRFPDRSSISGVVERACSLLDEHWSEDLRSSTLAGEVGLSRFHFIRLFRRHVGLTPRAYARNVRLIRAKRLIQEGVSVAETAATTRFSDQSHLTREFNRVYGVSPGALKPPGGATGAMVWDRRDCPQRTVSSVGHERRPRGGGAHRYE